MTWKTDPPDEAGTRQFLAFKLGSEEYAVDILRVQEIRVWEKATRLPHTPEYVKGVINLRGEVVPVVDLRERFGEAAAAYGPRTVVIVFLVGTGERRRVVGAVVDAVSDVFTLSESCIAPCPDVNILVSHEMVLGLATVEDRMLILLDVDRTLNFEPPTRNGESA